MENKNRAGHAQINARGDCVDLASAGSGRRSENPPALAVGSVKRIRRFAPCPPSDDFPRWNETSASGSGVVGLI